VNDRSALHFPRNFIWGVATSAYQIEGALREDGRGASVWDRFCAQSGRIKTGEDAQIACDHYHRYREDVALMAQLGLTTYRFSIGWPRIQPEGRGAPNQKGLDFYSRLVDELLEHGIQPTATLFHWDLPQALQNEGGWLNRATAERFAEYARIVGRHLGDRVQRWITHNETFEHSMLGHGIGTHAPGTTLMLDAFPVAHHLLLSHGRAVQALRATLRLGSEIGIAQSFSRAMPATSSTGDWLAGHVLETLQFGMNCDPLMLGCYPAELAELGIDMSAVRTGDLATIAQPLDFLGVNYYNPQPVRAAPPDSPLPLEEAPAPAQYEHTEMGWPIVPEGLRDVLLYLRERYGRKLPPIILTENGTAVPDTVGADGQVDDPRRVAYLQAHLQVLRQVMDEGVDVRGYFVWSLLDNFEWAEGYRPRFGLVHVDYPTQKRTPKRSFHWYRELIAAQA
jgi:beta-glucosidase